MIVGKIKVFDITDFQAMLSNMDKHTFKGAGNKRVQLLPASAQLMVDKQALKSFGSRKQAHQYLEKLGADEAQLKSIVQGLPPAAKPVENASPLDTVVQSLMDGNLVVAETETNSVRSKESAENSGSEAEAASGADTQPISHGPHQEGIVGTKASNDEQVKEEPVCELTKFSVRCDHYGSRGFLLDGLSGDYNFNDVDNVVQVISPKGKPDQLNVAFTGTCAHGKADCPSISISSDSLNEKISASPHKFPAAAPKPSREINSFKDFLRYCMVPSLGSLDPQIFSLKADGCSDTQSCEAKIHAFPTFKWEGNVSMGYTTKQSKGWELKAGLKGNIGPNEWDFEAGSVLDFFPELHSIIDPVISRINDIASKGAEVVPGTSNGKGNELIETDISSAVALAGSLELKEVESKHNVDISGSVALKLAPLVQADIETDIISWVIKAHETTPIGALVKEIRDKAKKGVGNKKVNASAEISIKLKVSGGLTADLSWTKDAGKRWRSEKAAKASQGSANLTVGLKAEAKAEANIWYVKVAMGLELSLQGAQSEAEGIGAVITLASATVNGKPTLDGKVQFTGAAIYYAYYAEISKREIESDNSEESKRRRGGKRRSKQSSKAKERNAAGHITIFSPSQWPKQPDKYSIDELDL